jgi:DNA helicase-2/ATP-dependent DNA helicase PcrA
VALYQRRFRHILVDEYQDTKSMPIPLIRELVPAVAPNLLGALTV